MPTIVNIRCITCRQGMIFLKMAGVIFVVIGVILLPFGILQFKKEWKAYRKFSPKTQKVFVLIEIFDVLSGVPILSTWLMYLSAFCIVMGVIMITTH